jgi:hypothetical protein
MIGQYRLQQTWPVISDAFAVWQYTHTNHHEKLCPVNHHNLDYSSGSFASPTPVYCFILLAITLARHSVCSPNWPQLISKLMSQIGYILLEWSVYQVLIGAVLEFCLCVFILFAVFPATQCKDFILCLKRVWSLPTFLQCTMLRSSGTCHPCVSVNTLRPAAI